MKREIVDYIVICDDNHKDFEDMVKNAIQLGYAPQGGVSCNGDLICQAMVKYDFGPDDSKPLYNESHLKDIDSLPRIDLDIDKGEYPPISRNVLEKAAPLPDKELMTTDRFVKEVLSNAREPEYLPCR